MLNLSDKELDRLSREAASAYDPGEPAGAGSWDMLKLNLDKELGKTSPNPLHAIRRIPFYYAPVIVLLAGVSYYFIRQGRNNSRAAPTPASPVNPQQLTQNNSDKPNSTPYNEHTTDKKGTSTSDKAGTGTTAANTPANGDASSGAKAPASASAPAGAKASAGSGAPATTGPASSGKSAGSNVRANASNPKGSNTRVSPDAPASTGNSASAGALLPSTNRAGQTNVAGLPVQQNTRTHSGQYNTSGQSGSNGAAHPGHHRLPVHSGKDLAATQFPQQGSANRPVSQPTTNQPGSQSTTNRPGQQPVTDQDPDKSATSPSGKPTAAEHGGQPGNQIPAGQSGQKDLADLSRSVVRKPYPLSKAPAINDSALRKLTAKTAFNNSALINVGKKNNQSLHVYRSFQLGFTLAPDFASVHSLAGDKPGSVTGITLDYEFVSRWYIGTGLLYSRRNYTARAEDYHVPPYYYQMNNMHDVNYIKGSFHMLEIPINLRYDFSLAGNTVFFASAGVSSYLHSNENCSYYYSFFGREAYRKFSYPVRHAPIFSVINLSMGVEAGISNSFSFLVAPYMKLPTNSIGFGKIDMNSIGVNFGVKYSPVLKRSRK